MPLPSSFFYEVPSFCTHQRPILSWRNRSIVRRVSLHARRPLPETVGQRRTKRSPSAQTARRSEARACARIIDLRTGQRRLGHARRIAPSAELPRQTRADGLELRVETGESVSCTWSVVRRPQTCMDEYAQRLHTLSVGLKNKLLLEYTVLQRKNTPQWRCLVSKGRSMLSLPLVESTFTAAERGGKSGAM